MIKHCLRNARRSEAECWCTYIYIHNRMSYYDLWFIYVYFTGLTKLEIVKTLAQYWHVKEIYCKRAERCQKGLRCNFSDHLVEAMMYYDDSGLYIYVWSVDKNIRVSLFLFFEIPLKYALIGTVQIVNEIVYQNKTYFSPPKRRPAYDVRPKFSNIFSTISFTLIPE